MVAGDGDSRDAPLRPVGSSGIDQSRRRARDCVEFQVRHGVRDAYRARRPLDAATMTADQLEFRDNRTLTQSTTATNELRAPASYPIPYPLAGGIWGYGCTLVDGLYAQTLLFCMARTGLLISWLKVRVLRGSPANYSRIDPLDATRGSFVLSAVAPAVPPVGEPMPSKIASMRAAARSVVRLSAAVGARSRVSPLTL